MKIFKNKYAIKKAIFNKEISFIPTMGGLHKAHINLIKKSKKFKYKILVSIFINPKQFDNSRDFNLYPRNIKKDIDILKKLNVNYLYLPSFKDIYGFKTKNKIFLNKFSKKLCGKFRKNHFKGVLNIVNRFLEIIKPKYIFLGKKDFQQLFLIKSHIKKKKIRSKVIECNTIRESNGIAASTRNFKLSKKHKEIAAKIFKFLINIKKKMKRGHKFTDPKMLKKKIIKIGAQKVDYIEIFNVDTFKKAKKTGENFRIFIAYYINNVRLIDNI